MRSNLSGDINMRVVIDRKIEALNSLSSLMVRVSTGDVHETAIRRAKTVSIGFTSKERQLYDDGLQVEQILAQARFGAGHIRFLATNYARRAASSIHGLAMDAEKNVLGRFREIARDIAGDLSPEVSTKLWQLIDRMDGCFANFPIADAKADALIEIASTKGQSDNTKLLVFSTFRSTVAYVHGVMQACGLRSAVLHGGLSDTERRDACEAFKRSSCESGAVDVLIATEIGGEGLDFQFCDTVVNWDVPWNPMAIEQRIGRIDRYGQASPVVFIYNFVMSDTIEAKVVDRCLNRIGIFERSVGALEPIFGPLTAALKAVDLDPSLSEKEQEVRLKRIEEVELRGVLDQAEFDKRKRELLGLPEADDTTLLQGGDKTYLIDAHAIENIVVSALQRQFGFEHDPIRGSGPIKSLQLAASYREIMLDLVRAERGRPAERRWQAYLASDHPNLRITFDQKTAQANVDVVYISATHSLVRWAVEQRAEAQEAVVAMEVADSQLPEGEHAFAIYRWTKIGLATSSDLVAVASDSAVGERLLEVLPQAFARPAEWEQVPSLDDLSDHHHSIWSDERTRFRAQVSRQADARRISLSTGYEAQRRSIKFQLSTRADPAIRILLNGRLDRARSIYERKVEAIEQTIQSADLLFRRVATGTLLVRPS